jgi:hypothetical protein
MTTRKGKSRERLSRRKIAWAIGVAAGLALPGAIGLACHRQALARWQQERDRAVQIREQASSEASRTQKKKAAEWRAAWSRAAVARQPHYELLATLARATPPSIVLRELRCEGDGFRLEGRVCEKANRPDSPLIQFCQDLAPRSAPWRWPGAPETAATDFAWQGVFQTEAAAPPTEADAAQWEARAALVRDSLPTEKDFEAAAEDWNRHWTVVAQPGAEFPDLEVRHYALAYPHPTLRAWSDIVQTVRELCAEPGVTLDGLVLAAAPDGGDAFTQARITLTARLRR